MQLMVFVELFSRVFKRYKQPEKIHARILVNVYEIFHKSKKISFQLYFSVKFLLPLWHHNANKQFIP